MISLVQVLLHQWRLCLLAPVSSAFTYQEPFNRIIFNIKAPWALLRYYQRSSRHQGCSCYNVLTRTDNPLIFNYNALNQGWLAGWLWEYKPNSKTSQKLLADSIQGSYFVGGFLTNLNNMSENSPVTYLNRQHSEEVVHHHTQNSPSLLI